MNKETEGIDVKGMGLKETMYQMLKSDPKLIEKLKEIAKLADGLLNDSDRKV